jgi:glycosyltransferase involved in cell wall biosynthesis
VFYAISTWTARKAVWRTLHAYCSAFTARDETTLVVKTDSSGPSHEAGTRRYPVHELVRDLVGNYPDAPGVCLIVRDLAQAEVDDLHAAGDCYVSLTHAEGWGLGAFDAACRDKPVVMTGWGGQLDYLSPADACLVDYDLADVVDGLGDGSYLRTQQWAVARLEAAADMLQWIHGHRDEAAALGARLGARVRRDFGGAQIIARLRELLGV